MLTFPWFRHCSCTLVVHEPAPQPTYLCFLLPLLSSRPPTTIYLSICFFFLSFFFFFYSEKCVPPLFFTQPVFFCVLTAFLFCPSFIALFPFSFFFPAFTKIHQLYSESKLLMLSDVLMNCFLFLYYFNLLQKITREATQMGKQPPELHEKQPRWETTPRNPP